MQTIEPRRIGIAECHRHTTRGETTLAQLVATTEAEILHADAENHA